MARPLEDSAYKMYRSESGIRNSLRKIYPYYFFAPEWVANKFTKQGKAYRDLGGMVEQGKLILSKYPITHGYNYFYHKVYEFDCDRSRFYEGDDHGRALQVAEINIRGKIFQVGNIHGSYSREKYDTKKSLLQSEFIIRKLKEKKLPTVLVGDFNVLPTTKSIAILNKEYKNLNKMFNITTSLPDGRVIDYIFTSKEWKAKSFRVGTTDISDHYPLVAELTLS